MPSSSCVLEDFFPTIFLARAASPGEHPFLRNLCLLVERNGHSAGPRLHRVAEAWVYYGCHPHWWERPIDDNLWVEYQVSAWPQYMGLRTKDSLTHLYSPPCPLGSVIAPCRRPLPMLVPDLGFKSEARTVPMVTRRHQAKESTANVTIIWTRYYFSNIGAC